MKKTLYFIFILGLLVLSGSIDQLVHGGESAGVDEYASDFNSQSMISIDELRELKNRKENFLLFNARGKESYDEGHIEGAVLPLPLMYYQEKQLLAAGVISKPFDLDQTLF